MKKRTRVLLFIFLALVLLISGLAFALSPPFAVAVPRGLAHEDLAPALKTYLLERAALALEDYSGTGDLAVTLDAAGLSQILADAIAPYADQAPKGLKFHGAYAGISEKGVTTGGCFKFLFFSLGVSGRLKAELVDGELVLQLESAQLGRIPLPFSLAKKIVTKYSGADEELRFSIPLADEAEVTAIELKSRELILNILIPEGVLLELDEEILADLEELKPQVEPILAANPKALAVLDEIEELIDKAKANGKPVNLLRLKLLADEFYSYLSPAEISQLQAIVDKETMNYLEQLAD